MIERAWVGQFSEAECILNWGSQQGHVHKAFQSGVFSHTSLAQTQHALLCVFWHFTLIAFRLASWRNIWIFCVFTCVPHLLYPKPLARLWTDGRQGRPHSHLSAHSAPLHFSAPISRWAEHGAATCKALQGHLLKAVTSNALPNPFCPSIHSQWALP